MDFPITDLMDEPACYAQLVDWLYPDGMTYPRTVPTPLPARHGPGNWS